MDKTCATCQWYVEETMRCMNDRSDVFMTGPLGTCPCWENYDYDMWGEE